MNAHKLIRQLFVWILLSAPLVASAGVIAHPGVGVSTLSSASLRNIYTLRQTQWPNRLAIVIFVLPDDHPVHETFSKEKLGMYPYRLRQTWDRLSFSGMAKAPIEVRDEQEMLAQVRSTPGAIGYTSKDISYDGIKIIRLD